MKRLKRTAVVTRLIEQLREQDSWCGETHVQKATYLLQELSHVPVGFEFTLYKYGPYSFELRDDLTSMRADRIVELEYELLYGPRIRVTKRGKRIQDLYPFTLKRYNDRIELITKFIGSNGVDELERIGTAFFVISHLGSAKYNKSQVVDELLDLKPHLARKSAKESVDRLSAFLKSI